MTLRPIQWEVREPLTGNVMAIIQVVHLGPRQEPYYRSVTANPDPSKRKLVGYWGTPNEAHDGTIALYEQRVGRSLSGGGLPPSELVPQKPPPARDPNRPVEHVRAMEALSSRASQERRPR